MHLFMSVNKMEAMKVRDLLNELLSDPELDRPDCTVELENDFGRIKVSRTFKVKENEET